MIVDSEHVDPVTPMGWDELRYRPHHRPFGGEEIVVVVRDRELSNAQESGMDAGWFIARGRARTRHCDFPPLVTTATDGDNGGWFRNTSPRPTSGAASTASCWSGSAPTDADGIRPMLHQRLPRPPRRPRLGHGAPGAWNTGWHDGAGFAQWIGSPAQQQALTRLAEISDSRLRARRNAIGIGADDPGLYRLLEEAHWRVLRAETSCNFFWGDAWVQRCHDDLDAAAAYLEYA